MIESTSETPFSSPAPPFLEGSQLLSMLPAAMQAAIIATDQAGVVAYWNPFAEKLYGWPAAEVVGRNIMEITVSDVTEKEARTHMASVQAGNSWAGEFRVLCRDGKYVEAFVTLSPVRDRNGANVGIVGVSQDLKVLKETETALRRSEEQFHAFANSLPELCWMAHGDGHLFWYNDRWFEYTGTTPKEMEGWGWQVVHDPEILPSVLERWKASIHSGHPFEMQFPLRGADGVFRWFLTRVRPVRDESGKVIRWYGTNTNIDEQRHMLQSLSEAREQLEKRVQERTGELKAANADLRELSARLLHMRDEEQRRLARELHDSVGQLVAAIGMNLGVITRETDKLSTAAARCLTENSALLQEVSREIRTLSHLLHPPLLDEAGLESALRWYAEGFAERSKIDVRLEIAPNFPRLANNTEIAIFRLIQECLTNIHRHSGSTTASIEIRELGSRLLVQVRDTGRGISGDKQDNISAGRSGVGVSGMRERLRELGGTLRIQSNDDGTVVSALLPMSQGAVTPESGD